MENSKSFQKCVSQCPRNESLGRLIVPWTVIEFHEVLSFHFEPIYCYCATTDASNDLINFPMCMSAMKKDRSL